MNTLIRFLSFSTLLLLGCETQEHLVPYTLYHIKKGEHSSGAHVHELEHTTLKFEVIFDQSCKYVFEGEAASDQADINKLFGFADCNDQHHENSARFGWRWNKGKFEVLAYVYNNGVWTSNEKKPDYNPWLIKLGASHYYTIEMDDDNYYFTINGVVDRYPMKRTNDCTKGVYYLLYPYFGGNQVAPHDMYIHMKRLI